MKKSKPILESSYQITSLPDYDIRAERVDLFASLTSIFDRYFLYLSLGCFIKMIILALVSFVLFEKIKLYKSLVKAISQIFGTATYDLRKKETFSESDRHSNSRKPFDYLSRKLLLATLRIFVLAVTILVGAEFGSTMVVPKIPSLINTFQDLYESGIYIPLFVTNNPITSDFEHGVSPMHRKIWDKAKRIGLHKTVLSADDYYEMRGFSNRSLFSSAAAITPSFLRKSNLRNFCCYYNVKPHFSKEQLGKFAFVYPMTSSLALSSERHINRE